jgi:uracil-DNA glycosylase family 4
VDLRGLAQRQSAALASSSASSKSLLSNELLWAHECKACPLNRAKHLHSPKIEPSGSKEPLIYVLGEAPGEVEDEEGRQFVGSSGELIRPFFPGRIRSQVRWNNTIRCRPSLDNRNPDKIEIECCRPSIERDIEATAPDAIFGMGGVPLAWAGKHGGITLWRGRRFPIKVGKHVCWYYPMFHPSYLLHQRRTNGSGRQLQSDDEFAYELDLRRAIAEVEAGLPEPVVYSPEMMRENVTTITGRSSSHLRYVLEFLEYAGTCDVVGVDYETQHERPYYPDSSILTMGVSAPDETVAFAYNHPDAGWQADDRERLTSAWIRFLKTKATKAVHSLAFEMEWSCSLFGLDLARSVPWEDTLTQAFVLDERVGDKVALGLGFLTSQYFGIDIKKLTRGLKKDDMRSEPLEVLLPYNGVDAKGHRLLFNCQEKRIGEEELVEVYREKLEQVPTVVLTQIKGIEIDPKANAELSAEYKQKLQAAVERIEELPEATQYKRLTGEKFNPGSPQHVIVMLKDVLKTREGQAGAGWSTKESVLDKIENPIGKAILEFRKVQKLKSTYVDPVSPGSPILYPGGVIHTNLGTCFTETGRLESTDPNIQNWPVRSAAGKRVRRQVKAGVFASFDYGQIDARIIACGSRDKNYCKALWANYDIHAEWAERLAYHHPEWVGGKKLLKDKAVLKAFRDKSVKNSFVFALFYGAALRTTAARFGVDERTMAKPYDEFWDQFAGVKVWQQQLAKQYTELGYVQLFGGLRRRAPLGHGQQINTPVQGATNRIVMSGMNRLSQLGNMVLQANFQIHDDLSFCFVSEREFEDSIPTILDTMLDGREFPWFIVPLEVEIKSGPNWGDTAKIDTYSSVKRLGWPSRLPEFA